MSSELVVIPAAGACDEHNVKMTTKSLVRRIVPPGEVGLSVAKADFAEFHMDAERLDFEAQPAQPASF